MLLLPTERRAGTGPRPLGPFLVVRRLLLRSLDQKSQHLPTPGNPGFDSFLAICSITITQIRLQTLSPAFSRQAFCQFADGKPVYSSFYETDVSCPVWWCSDSLRQSSLTIAVGRSVYLPGLASCQCESEHQPSRFTP